MFSVVCLYVLTDLFFLLLFSVVVCIYFTDLLFLFSCFLLFVCIYLTDLFFLLLLFSAVIIGIGADDIFVFVDAFKQSALEPDHISGR